MSRRADARHVCPDSQRHCSNSRRGLLVFAAGQPDTAQLFVAIPGGRRCRQVTFLSASCRAIGWAGDDLIAFATSSGQAFRQQIATWLLNLGTGETTLLHRSMIVRPGIDGLTVATTAGVDPRLWHGYRGGATGDIWIAAKRLRRITPMPGNIAAPIACSGRIYFIGEDGQRIGLFSCDPNGEDLRAHDTHSTYPPHSAATDGRRIVYCAGGNLYVLTPGGAAEPVAIRLDRSLRPRRLLPLATGIQGLIGKVCCAYGGIYATEAGRWSGVPLDAGRTCMLMAAALPHGQLLAVLSGPTDDIFAVLDSNGAVQRFLRPRLELGRIVALAASSGSALVLVGTHRCELFAMTIDTGACRLLDRSAWRPIGQIAISHDGQQGAYALPTGVRRSMIRVVHTDGSGPLAETDPPLSDGAVAMTRDGSVLFLSLIDDPERRSGPLAALYVMTASAQGTMRARRLEMPAGPYDAIRIVGDDVVLLARSERALTLERMPFVAGAPRLWRAAAAEATAIDDKRILLRSSEQLGIGDLEDGSVLPLASVGIGEYVEATVASIARATITRVWRLVADEVMPAIWTAADWESLLLRYRDLANRAMTLRDRIDIANEMLGHLGVSHAHVTTRSGSRWPHSGERSQRYAAWVAARRRQLREGTRGTADYLHLLDVSPSTRATVEEWLWYREGVTGLVVDLRFNEGGTEAVEIAELLARTPLGTMRTRWSATADLPLASPRRRLLVIINRFTASGGEVLASILRLTMGCPILGERSFGAGMGHTFARPLPDGTSLSLPEIHITAPPVCGDIENRGVTADITITGRPTNDLPDRAIARALVELARPTMGP